MVKFVVSTSFNCCALIISPQLDLLVDNAFLSISTQVRFIPITLFWNTYKEEYWKPLILPCITFFDELLFPCLTLLFGSFISHTLIVVPTDLFPLASYIIIPLFADGFTVCARPVRLFFLLPRVSTYVISNLLFLHIREIWLTILLFSILVEMPADCWRLFVLILLVASIWSVDASIKYNQRTFLTVKLVLILGLLHSFVLLK